MNESKKKAESKLLINVLIASFLITLAVVPTIKDPINSPKLWFLLVLSCWLLPKYFEKSKDQVRTNSEKKFTLILIFLVISFLLSTLFSDNKYRAIFGDTQRRNGLLAYLGLIAFALLASKIGVFWHNKFNNLWTVSKFWA
jgi:hypothetical protein